MSRGTRGIAARNQQGPSTKKLVTKTVAQVHTSNRPHRKRSAAVEQGMPATEQQKKLAAEYLKDYDFMAAARRAGYQGSEDSVMAVFRKIAPYIREAQLAKAREVGKRVATSQEDILSDMAAEAHYSEMDFVVIEQGVLPGKREVVTIRRQKYLEELTPQQQRLITNIRFNKDGTASYSLPNRNEARKLIGRHLGMFNDKLIMEHRHRQLTAKVDLSGVPDEELEYIEKRLLKHMGPAGFRLVGEYNREGGEEDADEGPAKAIAKR